MKKKEKGDEQKSNTNNPLTLSTARAPLKRYIPVLMAMARIYWDKENYPREVPRAFLDLPVHVWVLGSGVRTLSSDDSDATESPAGAQ